MRVIDVHRAPLARRAAAALALAAALLLATPPKLRAEPVTAEQHREAGYAHVERGAWDDAVRAYEAAYALDQDPVSLYAIGRVHVRRGDCAAAIAAFRRFLATEPPKKARASAESEVATCEATLAAATPEPPPVVEPPPPPPPPPPAPPRAFYRDPLGSALVGGGAVAAGLGLYFYVRARGAQCDDPCTGSYQDYRESVARAETWRTGAAVAGSVGGALIVAGAIRWVTARDRPAAVDVAIAPRAGGAAVVLGGRY
jgi:tetratricopeptide (TPR) repeat protein